jgi:hypothetical protein
VARKEVVREVRDNVKEPQHDAAIDDIKINVRASAKLTRMVTGSRRSSIDDDDDEVRTPGNRNHLVRVWEACQDWILMCLQGGRDHPLAVWRAKPVTLYRRPTGE